VRLVIAPGFTSATAPDGALVPDASGFSGFKSKSAIFQPLSLPRPGLAGLLTLGGVAAVFGATSPVGTAVLLSKSGGLPPTPPTCLITGPGVGCNAGVPGSCSIPNDGNGVGSSGAFSSEPSALANGFSWRASPFTFVYRTTPSRAKNEHVINKPNLVSR